MSIHDLTASLDLKQNLNIYATCKQFDSLNLILSIYNNSVQADLTNYNIRLRAMKRDLVPLIQEHVGITPLGNVVTIAADEQLTTTSGRTLIEIQFINKTTGLKKATFNLVLIVVPSILEVDRTISKATYTLLEELENKLDQASDFFENIDEAITSNTNLENTISNSVTAKNNLESTISTGNTLKTGLENDISTGNTLKTNLETTITNANNSKSALETSKTNADTSKVALDLSITESQQFVAEHQDVNNLITEVANHTTQLSDMAKYYISASHPPVPLVGIKIDGTDTSTELNNILSFAALNNIPEVVLPFGNIKVATTINIPKSVKLRGCGKRKTYLTSLTSSMTIVTCNNNNFQISDCTIQGKDKTETGIFVNASGNTGGVSCWIIERVEITNCLWGVQCFYVWDCTIRDCNIFQNKYGIFCQSQCNAMAIINTSIMTTSGHNLRLANSANIDIIGGSSITQIETGDSHITPVYIYGTSTSNINIEGVYFEGIFSDVSLFELGSASTSVKNIKVSNCNLSALTAPSRVAILKNVDSVEFSNNLFTYSEAQPFDLSTTYGSKNINVKGNNNNNWGFSEQINKNIVVNSELFCWDSGTNAYPSGYTKKGASSVQVVGKGSDGSVKFSTDLDNTGFDIKLEPLSLYYPTVKFSAKSDNIGTIVLMLSTVDSSGTAHNIGGMPIPVTTEYKEYEFVYPVFADKKGYGDVISFTSASWGNTINTNIYIKDVVVIPALTSEIKEKQYLSNAIPTDKYWRIGNVVKNITPVVLGVVGAKYVVKEWIRITNGTSNVLNTDWIESRVLTGQ